MSRRLERHDVWMLITTVVLVAAMLSLAFPRTAEAQESQEAPEQMRVAAEPGDSLWSLAQQQVQPDATPEQIGNEVGRIFELNRERIGDNPNLIQAGQELLLPPKEGTELPGPLETEPLETEPSKTDTSGSERGVPGQADEPSALPDLLGLPVAEPVPVVGKVRVSPESRYEGRRMLGLGLLVLSGTLGILTAGVCLAQNLPRLRRTLGASAERRAGRAYAPPAGPIVDANLPKPESKSFESAQIKPAQDPPGEPKNADVRADVPGEHQELLSAAPAREDLPVKTARKDNRDELDERHDEPGTRSLRGAFLSVVSDPDPPPEEADKAPAEVWRRVVGGGE